MGPCLLYGIWYIRGMVSRLRIQGPMLRAHGLDLGLMVWIVEGVASQPKRIAGVRDPKALTELCWRQELRQRLGEAGRQQGASTEKFAKTHGS